MLALVVKVPKKRCSPVESSQIVLPLQLLRTGIMTNDHYYVTGSSSLPRKTEHWQMNFTAAQDEEACEQIRCEWPSKGLVILSQVGRDVLGASRLIDFPRYFAT